jgi:hypothetical protein
VFEAIASEGVLFVVHTAGEEDRGKPWLSGLLRHSTPRVLLAFLLRRAIEGF